MSHKATTCSLMESHLADLAGFSRHKVTHFY